MRIKKVSQIAGLVGSVVNSQSSSNKDTYSCDYINSLNTYSTTEQVVGKWIDGKPIYRKVVTGTRSTSQTDISYSSWNVNEFIAVKPIIYNSDGSYVYTQSYYVSSTDQWRCYIDANNKNITIHYGSSYPGSSGNYKVIVEYTKTTD